MHCYFSDLSPRDGRNSAMSTCTQDEQTEVDMEELDRLRKERLSIIQVLGQDYLPSSKKLF